MRRMLDKVEVGLRRRRFKVEKAQRGEHWEENVEEEKAPASHSVLKITFERIQHEPLDECFPVMREFLNVVN